MSRSLQPADAPLAAEGAAGLVAAVLFLGGFGLLATPPTPDQAPAELGGYLAGHRTEVFAATIALGAGSCLFFWYLSGVRRLLGNGAEPSLPTGAVMAAALATGLVLAGMSLLSALVLRDTGRELALLGFDMFNALVTMGGFGFGFSLVAAAAAGHRGAALPRGLVAAGLAIGPVQLLTIPGLFVESGFFAPLGPMALIAFWLLTAWYAAVAVRMVRRARRTPAPSAAGGGALR